MRSAFATPHFSSETGLSMMLKQKEIAVNGVLRLFEIVSTSTSLHDTIVHSLFVSYTCKQGALQSPIPWNTSTGTSAPCCLRKSRGSLPNKRNTRQHETKRYGTLQNETKRYNSIQGNDFTVYAIHDLGLLPVDYLNSSTLQAGGSNRNLHQTHFADLAASRKR